MNVGIGLSVSNFSSVPTVGLDLDAAIAALFSSGEEGAWYDPSDLTTLYQDSAGTTPVTAAGQPVGLMLDKSKGLTLGSELITNGTFDADLSGWGQAGAGNDWVWDAGKASAVATSKILFQSVFPVDGTNNSILTASGNGSFSTLYTVSGVTYQVSVDVSNYTSGTFSLQHSSTGGNIKTAQGFTGSIDNISVRELPGNHATQSTSTARPTLQLSGSSYYLDFDGVDDFMKSSSFTALSQPISTAVAFRSNSIVDFIYDGHASNELSLITLDDSGVDSLRIVSNASAPFLLVPYTDGVDTVVRALYDGASSVLAINGVDNAGSVAATSDPTQWTLGDNGSASGSSNLDGRIYGFIGVSRTLTAGEIDDVEAYLAAKSGVTL